MPNHQIIRPVTLRHIENEEVQGINGINTQFTTNETFEQDTLKVYLNGLRLRVGSANDYILSGSNQFNMNYAPENGDIISVDYLRLKWNPNN